VVREAKKRLAELEKQLRPAPAHPDLFAADAAPAAPKPTEDPIAAALAAIDPDRLSPKEALDALYKLKRLLDD